MNDMENHQNQNKNPNQDLQGWGTWEELLLASAVDRHGFKDWDTIAVEVQSRTNRTSLLATAHHCEQKFHDLNRRFKDDVPPPQQNGDVAAATAEDSDHVPWLDKLRKQRVAELRRDVQRSDVSILSLQLQVKKLEDEKAKENEEKVETEPDLAVSGEGRLPENEKTGGDIDEPVPDIRRLDESTTNTDKLLPAAGEESDRDNQSVNESNSTGSRFDALKTGEVDVKLGSGPGHGSGSVQVKSGLNEPDQTGRKRKSVEEESNNGSYDNNEAKAVTCESVPPSEERKVEDDSVTRSEGGGTRESSEVQSSSSLSKTRRTQRRRKEVSGEDAKMENEDVAVVKSEPLFGVLEMIKRHEKFSLFERRLEKNQDLDRYKNTVKRHVDLETIQLRVQEGHYSSGTNTFFLDLVTLFSNATVFFSRGSPELRAAQQLRRLILDEMKTFGQAQSNTITQKSDSLPPNTPLSRPDSLSKHKPPILVCRKRSSIPVKPSTTTFSHKGDHKPIINDKKERPSSDVKPTLKPSYSETDEEEPPKAKEKPVTGARSRRSNKNLSSNASNKKPPSNSTPRTGSSANKPAETPKLKNKAEGVSDKKKNNGAAGFLNRIKKNESVEVLRSGSGGGGGSSGSSKGGGGGGTNTKEQKKVVNNGKGEKGKERASRYNDGGGSGSGDKRNKNIESNSKRNVGRPPKKAAETVASTKRGRESSASGGKDKRPKKRSKK